MRIPEAEPSSLSDEGPPEGDGTMALKDPEYTHIVGTVQYHFSGAHEFILELLEMN